jgi:hypothetical protein
MSQPPSRTSLSDMTDPGPNQIQFQWKLAVESTQAEAKPVVEALNAGGGTVAATPTPIGILPILIPIVIYGVVQAVGLTEQVVDWWSNRQKHGMIIRIGPDGSVEITDSEQLPSGQVIFIDRDGTSATHMDVSGDQLKSLLKNATSAVKKR